MNNDYSFIPFCKIVSGVLNDTETLEVSLLDTVGDPITCNYIRVSRIGALAIATANLNYGGYWYVRPNIGYADTSHDLSSTADRSYASGVGAFVSSGGEGFIELRLPKTKLCSSIFIGNLTGSDQDFAITYGFIEPASPIEKIAARNKGV